MSTVKWKPVIQTTASGWRWGAVRYGTEVLSDRSTYFRRWAEFRAKRAAERFEQSSPHNRKSV